MAEIVKNPDQTDFDNKNHADGWKLFIKFQLNISALKAKEEIEEHKFIVWHWWGRVWKGHIYFWGNGGPDEIHESCRKIRRIFYTHKKYN